MTGKPGSLAFVNLLKYNPSAEFLFYLTDFLPGVDAVVFASDCVASFCFVGVLDERVAPMSRHPNHVSVALKDRSNILFADEHCVQVSDEYSRPHRYRVRVVRHVTYLAHHYCGQISVGLSQ